MNQKVYNFLSTHYAPGRVCLIGSRDEIGMLIRWGQAPLTPDKGPSRWSHSFIMGERRGDGEIYIFESDLHVDAGTWQVRNGAMESRLSKWCGDVIEHACVLGMNLGAGESNACITSAMKLSYGEPRYSYPVGELFGTLWAILTRSLSKKNIFNRKYAVQCATFVRMNYQAINRDPLDASVHLDNTSPEALYQSGAFSVREVMQ